MENARPPERTDDLVDVSEVLQLVFAVEGIHSRVLELKWTDYLEFVPGLKTLICLKSGWKLMIS